MKTRLPTSVQPLDKRTVLSVVTCTVDTGFSKCQLLTGPTRPNPKTVRQLRAQQVFGHEGGENAALRQRVLSPLTSCHKTGTVLSRPQPSELGVCQALTA